MPSSGRLSARKVATAKVPGRYADGGNLFLLVKPGGAKSWVFRYKVNYRERQMGLGPVDLVSLADAREKALSYRRQLADGIDPQEHRRDEKAAAEKESARAITFETAAESYIEAHEAAWRNEKHKGQWRSTLKTYAYPVFGDKPVADVDTGLVLQAIEPIWSTKPETASRLRGRIESVLDWAAVDGLREGLNPARWRGHLQNRLPAKAKVRKVEHHAALPYAELPAFMATLREQVGTSARALEFAILTVARTSEVLGATWDEIDLDRDGGAVWTIPADRMKAGKEHRVPLPPAAARIVQDMGTMFGRTGYVFPGQRKGKPLSNMAFLMLLRRMGRGDLTAHGFRSTFRDWVAETTSYPSEIAEQALAHIVGSAVERAYRRGDVFEKRRALMADWINFSVGFSYHQNKIDAL
ncbi:integrase arm-type DNA-binding domain-containing protein [Fodinicurvata sp. EGI_FJ10296]|uniref:tyrosine-type recombinase/integrase n=1 Tax=Fodinicurvata sp. EGI_FJ10296 TaxID=3231908 RepID=UPI003451DB8D